MTFTTRMPIASPRAHPNRVKRCPARFRKAIDGRETRPTLCPPAIETAGFSARMRFAVSLDRRHPAPYGDDYRSHLKQERTPSSVGLPWIVPHQKNALRRLEATSRTAIEAFHARG